MRSVLIAAMCACALLLTVACGGIAEGPRRYTKTLTQGLRVSAPGAAWTLAIACDAEGDSVVDGGCFVGVGGSIVEDQPDGHGWQCGATQEDPTRIVSLEVWVECQAP